MGFRSWDRARGRDALHLVIGLDMGRTVHGSFLINLHQVQGPLRRLPQDGIPVGLVRDRIGKEGANSSNSYPRRRQASPTKQLAEGRAKAREADRKGGKVEVAEAAEEVMAMVDKAVREEAAVAIGIRQEEMMMDKEDKGMEEEGLIGKMLFGLISTNMDGDVYDKFGQYIDPKTPGGMCKEAIRQINEQPAPPAVFRLWQEEEVRSTIKVEELATDGSVRGPESKSPFLVQVEGDEELECEEPASKVLERVEDLVEKMRRLNFKMIMICEKVARPMVYLLGSEAGPSVKPACTALGSSPRSGMTFRPPRGQPAIPQAARTRSKKGDPSSSQKPPEEGEPREKAPTIRAEGEGEDDEEDERLRKQDEEQAALRAKKRKVEDGPERTTKGETTRKQKYAVPLEDGLDIEALVDQLLEGHNELLNLRDILASAPKLREELKARLSRRRMASVRLGDLIPTEAHWAAPGSKMDWKSMATGSVNFLIRGKPCAGMLNTSAEMNIIKEADALRLGMDIDRTDSCFLHGASGRTPFTGTVSNVVVEIERVKNFAGKTEQLRKLVRKDQEWEWGEKQEEVVNGLKAEFREGGLVLGVPDFEVTAVRPFIVETDAGPTALGGVIIQADANGEERPLRFESRTLNGTEKNYLPFKKETLAVLQSLRIFHNHLFGRRFVLRVDPTALACSLKNYAPADPTIARWLTYVWMFDFELERIPGDRNRVDGLSRINWDKASEGAKEDAPSVDAFLDEEEDVRLYINAYAVGVCGAVEQGRSAWLAPAGYERRANIVHKAFVEEDPWGGKDVEWMVKLALAETYRMDEKPLMIENGPQSLSAHAKYIGDVSLLINSLVQASECGEGNQSPVRDGEEDEFEEGEIKEAFRTDEYEGRHYRGAAARAADSRLQDKERWDWLPRVRKEPLKVGDVVLLFDFSKSVTLTGEGVGRVIFSGANSMMAEQSGHRPASMGPSDPFSYDGGHVFPFLDTVVECAMALWLGQAELLARVRGRDEYEGPVARFARDALDWRKFAREMMTLQPHPTDHWGRPIRFNGGNLDDFEDAFVAFGERQGWNESQMHFQVRFWVVPRFADEVDTLVLETADWVALMKALRNAFPPWRRHLLQELTRDWVPEFKEPQRTYHRETRTSRTAETSRPSHRRTRHSSREGFAPPVELEARELVSGSRDTISSPGIEGVPQCPRLEIMGPNETSSVKQPRLKAMARRAPTDERSHSEQASGVPILMIRYGSGVTERRPLGDQQTEEQPRKSPYVSIGPPFQVEAQRADEMGTGVDQPFIAQSSEQQSQEGELQDETEDLLMAQLYCMEPPIGRNRRGVEGEPSPMDREQERIEEEILEVGGAWHVAEGSASDKVAPVVGPEEIPEHSGTREGVTAEGIPERGDQRPTKVLTVEADTPMDGTQGSAGQTSTEMDIALAQELAQLPPMLFPSWLAFERLGQAYQQGGERMVWGRYMQTSFGRGSTPREGLQQQVRRQTRSGIYIEDGAMMRQQEEIKRRRRLKGLEPMAEVDVEQAEGRLAAVLLSEASVEGLVEVLQHVKGLTRRGLDHDERIEEGALRIETLEREFDYTRCQMERVITEWELGRRTGPGLSDQAQRRALDPVGQRGTEGRQVPTGQGPASPEIEPGGTRVGSIARDEQAEQRREPAEEIQDGERTADQRGEILQEGLGELPRAQPAADSPTVLLSLSPLEHVSRFLASGSDEPVSDAAIRSTGRGLSPDTTEGGVAQPEVSSQHEEARQGGLDWQEESGPEAPRRATKRRNDRPRALPVCFFCDDSRHRIEGCAAFQRDMDMGLARRDALGRIRDRNGTLLPKMRHGGRQQLYMQLQMELRED
ncbi:hypothetical protein CBR_g8286 [Chara braunii]|uniref:Reverse transcriptase RNase H-like domain-containing protein n=1 Tax=Chara braunii TaxID=69332 RepID=A0A388KLQ6_CHABU|nr:hypothetical protein CBR_g8286 [Chara braunii]|eukprot:GBG70986.1 hypothetical protein CBR_g8286 [Chara braunii]